MTGKGASFNSQVRSFAEDLPILGSVIELILGERFTDRSEKSIFRYRRSRSTKMRKKNKTIHGLNPKILAPKDKQILKKAEKNMEILKRIITVLGDYQKIVGR